MGRRGAGGVTLRERWLDADTVEYSVRRPRRDALARSSAGAWLLLAASLLSAGSLTGTADDGVGDPPPARLAHLGALVALFLAARACASSVVEESALVMRHVGVRLGAVRALGARDRPRFLDVGRLRSLVVSEVLTSRDVFYQLCFRHRDGDEDAGRVIVAFPELRPNLRVLRAVYAGAHAALFEDASDDRRVLRARDGDDDESDDEGSRSSPLEPPELGRGWWGEGETWRCSRRAPFDGDGFSLLEGSPGPGPASPASPAPARESVLMVSDFFLPNTGGVELHMYSLAQRLIARGHRVTVLTHAYGDRCGVRHMAGGLKVYYAFRVPVYNGATCPDIFGTFRLLRRVLIRERITLVHAHQTFSVMGHEAVFHARTMGYKCVFTDHSLFGFEDASAIHMNKLLVLTLADCNHVVCVSHTAKENTVLRSGIHPERVSVIPNAVDAARFRPSILSASLTSEKDASNERVVVAVTARLAYRKGVHLLAAVIPLACERHPELDFLIAGDGPMREHLERTRDAHGLGDRVTLLGDVPHAEVGDALRRARVFLNCSLTESFCIAALEAACCGCLVVATKVGGVPEILPPDILFLAEPNAGAVADALSRAAETVKETRARRGATTKRGGGGGGGGAPSDLSPASIYERVAGMYSWDDVAGRVETVYARAHATEDTALGRLARLHSGGAFAGKLFCAVAAVDHLYWRWLEWEAPAAGIEHAPEFVPDGMEEAGGGGARGRARGEGRKRTPRNG